MKTLELYSTFDDGEYASQKILWINIHKKTVLFNEEFSRREDDGYWEEYPIEIIKEIKISEELSKTLQNVSDKEALDKILELLEPDFVEYLSDFKFA